MITIVKGSDPRLVIVLQQKDSCGIMPFNILNTMTVSFVYRDMLGTKTKTSQTADVEIYDAVYGKIFVNLSDVDTEKLKVGNLDFDIHVDDGPTKLIWKFQGKITVVDRIR